MAFYVALNFGLVGALHSARSTRRCGGAAKRQPLNSGRQALFFMSEKTVSESMFERLCAEHGIPCKKVPCSAAPTNDYDIFPNGQRIVCEIKQIDPNEDERVYARGEKTRLNPWPGNRVRDCIKDASRQLKAGSQGRFPTLLVVYNNVPFRSYTTAEDVLTAMYGQETVVVAVAHDPELEPFVTDVVFGGKRKMTPEFNTSISAVSVIFQGEGSCFLRVYHNDESPAIPLDPQILRFPGIQHFRRSKLEHDDGYGGWEAV